MAPVPQTDAGGRVENTKAIGRTMVKELGKMPPSLRKKEDPRREKRLRVASLNGWHRAGGSDCLTKTQQRAKPQGAVYAVTPAQCWKVTRIG